MTIPAISVQKKNGLKLPKHASSNGWSYSFMDLEQYVDSAADPKVRWIYRVMEVDASEAEM